MRAPERVPLDDASVSFTGVLTAYPTTCHHAINRSIAKRPLPRLASQAYPFHTLADNASIELRSAASLRGRRG